MRRQAGSPGLKTLTALVRRAADDTPVALMVDGVQISPTFTGVRGVRATLSSWPDDDPVQFAGREVVGLVTQAVACEDGLGYRKPDRVIVLLDVTEAPEFTP